MSLVSISSSRDGSRSRSGGDDQSLVRYLAVLRERRWVILICTALVFAATIVYVAVAPRTYQAQAEVEIQAASSSDSVLTGLPVLHQTGDPTQDVLTGASLVTTQPVAQAVVQSLGLKISAADALGMVAASPIGQASLVSVQATASSPDLARQLADGFVTQAIERSTTNMHAAIARELPTLENQLVHVPAAQRYGPGSLGAQVDELRQLQEENDPTLVSAASASLPTAPSSPKTKLSLVAGLVAGLMVGIGAAFLAHSVDPRLRREEQVRDRLGVPILARIARQSRGKRTRPLFPSELSPMALEGYQTLRTVVAVRGTGAGSRAILVTGSAPAEGKSTTSIGLAAALAQGGARVILIEADLRKPTFAGSFNLKEYQGIGAVLTGKIELSRALLPVRIGVAPVRILAVGAPGDLSGQLSSSLVHKLINDAKALCDFVVIDSAPLTAVIDALPFAQEADEVLIVARLDHTRLNKLDELTDLLTQHGVTRTGLVLIGEHAMRGRYYYAEGSGTRPEPARAVPARAGKGSPGR
jgi:capsular exopolysaccharide synthesis family protein